MSWATSCSSLLVPTRLVLAGPIGGTSAAESARPFVRMAQRRHDAAPHDHIAAADGTVRCTADPLCRLPTVHCPPSSACYLYFQFCLPDVSCAVFKLPHQWASRSSPTLRLCCLWLPHPVRCRPIRLLTLATARAVRRLLAAGLQQKWVTAACCRLRLLLICSPLRLLQQPLLALRPLC